MITVNWDLVETLNQEVAIEQALNSAGFLNPLSDVTVNLVGTRPSQRPK